MARTRLAFRHALAGLFVGAAALFIAIVVTGAVALASNGSARLPGAFDASALRENGAAALNFTPHFAGMAVVLVVFAVLSALLGLRRSDRAGAR